MVNIPSFSVHPNLLPSKLSLIPSEYSISMENQPPFLFYPSIKSFPSSFKRKDKGK
jgi:hypothetical protein